MESMFALICLAVTAGMVTGSNGGQQEEIFLEEVQSDSYVRNQGDILPETLRFNLRRVRQPARGIVPQMLPHLSLSENKRLGQNAPMLEARSLNGKSTLVKHEGNLNNDVKFYQDLSNRAAVQAECVDKNARNCRKMLTGVLEINNDLYEIAPSSRAFSNKRTFGRKRVPHVLSKIKVEDLKDILAHGTRGIEFNDAIEPYDDAPRRGSKMVFPPKESTRRTAREKIRQLLTDLLAKETLKPKDDDDLSHIELLKNSLRRAHETRAKRSFTEYAVEVLVVIDPSIWNRFRQESSSNEDARFNLRKHYSQIMNGVSLRYEEIVDDEYGMYMTISAFLYYTERSDESPEGNLNIIESGGISYVDYADYIYGLRDSWLPQTESSMQLPANDHVLVFTNHDLYADSIYSNGVIGVAFLNGACTGARLSVQEDKLYYRTITVVAHELGHNLGAHHDGSGEESGCSPDDKFIMRPYITTFSSTDTYTVNPWVFSPCSVAAFKRYITSLRSDNCMLNEGDHFDQDEYDQHNEYLPGELYSPTEQCQLAFGDSSYLCNSNPEDERLCINMQCYNPFRRSCQFETAAPGTPCGSDGTKWCYKGQCVTAERNDNDSDDGDDGGDSDGDGSGDGGDGTCVDTGYYSYSCSDLEDWYSEYGYEKADWCPYFEEECCETCSELNEPDECVDSTYYGYTCREIDDFYNSYGYDKDFWCPYFSDTCCQYCDGY